MINSEDIKAKLKKSLLAFDKIAINSLVSESIPPDKKINFVNDILFDVLKDIGDEWEKGEVALSQVYMSGIICEELVKKMFPEIKREKTDKSSTAIVTLSDYHILGKRIVYSVLKLHGYDLIDYGHGMGVTELVERILNDSIKIIFVSTLMLPSALKVKELRSELDKRNYKIKIIVGGAPFILDQQLWKEVKADRMGKTTTDALNIMSELTN